MNITGVNTAVVSSILKQGRSYERLRSKVPTVIHIQNETPDIHVLVHVWFIHTYDMISQTLTIMYKEHILAQMTIYNYMYMFVMQLYQI